MLREVILTQLGETMNDGTIASWYKQVGDRIEKGEPLCAVETDKTMLDIESPAAGYLAQIVALAGTTVPVLRVIGYLADRQDELAASQATPASTGDGAKAEPLKAVAQAAPSAPAPAPPEPASLPAVSPAARRLAKEHGVDLRQLNGTGPGGRVVEGDVRAFLQTQANGPQTPDTTVPAPGSKVEPPVGAAQSAVPAAGDWDLVPLSRMRRIIAEKLSQSYREAVHVTLHCEVDMAEAGKLRTLLSREWEPRHGAKVTFTDLMVKAVAMALAEHRAINASFTTEAIRLHRHINVGVAVSVANGLVVPVIRDADGLPLVDICRAVRTLSDRARSGQVNPDELHGGTFTITNMGMLGIDTFTPIINGGEGAILGVGRVTDKPAVLAGQLTIRPLMPLSLSFDHRVVDGAGAAAFLGRVRQLLESPDLVVGDRIKPAVDPQAKQEIIDKAYSLAYENEQKYGCCPQCVLAAVQDVLGIVDDATFKASHALAGGGGLSSGGTCGALSGGMLALSAKHGRDRASFATGRFLESYRLAKLLYDRFVAEFGSPICAKVQASLLGRSFDLWDARDFKAFQEAGGHGDKCPSVAGRVASWTAEMLLEAEEDA